MPPPLVIRHWSFVIPPRRQRRRGGFALLITITLLAFLVLLLVSLASLTRVETRVAGNSRQQAQARQNARLALNLALGQLQKYAGPDQRTTARADLQHAPGAPNARWTGVYGGGVAAGYAQTPAQLASALTTPGAADARGSSAQLLTWLVSGNEDVPFDPGTGVGSSGEITAAPAADDIPFRPDQAVNLTAANASPLSTQLTIAAASGARPTRLLVGPASIASSVANNVPIDYVAAPLVNIEAPASALPGFAATEPEQTVGRYAWWVGDEGLKARLNLPAPATLAEKTEAFASAPRAAVELVNPAATELPSPALDDPRLGAAYDPLSEVSRILALNQLPMSSPAQAAALSSAARHRFHDLTAHSLTVLSDTAAGGLKLDLSSALATGAATPAGTAPLFPPESGGAYAVPTWAHLRSFAQTTTAGPIAPRLPTSAGQSGIAPVLTYAALGFQYATDGANLRLALFPLVILWNPYTVPLAPADYEVGFVKRYNFARIKLQAETAPGTWEDRETRDLRRALAATGGTADSYVRFRVSTEEIPAGQSLVFTLTGTDSGQPYAAGNNRLTPALDPGGHAYMTGAAIAPGEAGLRHRVVPENTSNFVGGEMDVFLGSWPQPTSPAAAAPVGFNPAGKSWYQTLQRISSGGNNNLQDAAPLGAVIEPSFSLRIKAVFSGQGSNTSGLKLRWIAQSNPRAPLVTRLAGDASNNLTHSGFIGGGGNSVWQNFLPSPPPGIRASAGPGHDSDPDPIDVTLFELPRPGQPLLSLGQLQHAPLSLISAYPAYAFGNSLADYRFAAGLLHLTQPGPNLATSLLPTHYDLSWLLNHALWDRTFFSSVPATGAIPPTLPNPRHLRLDDYDGPELQQPERAAARLLLAGGFNINSTSEQAWRAVLGGLNRLAYDPLDPANGTAPALAGAPLPRFARPTAGDDPATPWQGYRLLTEDQIAQLARNLVAEIRARGPFVSLADFVNRRLVDNPDTPADERLKGALQAALDATPAAGIGIFPVNDDATAPFRAADGLVDTAPGGPYLLTHLRGGPASVAPYSSRSAFAPKFLTQADILSAVGAGLAARSDTFVIRAYGENVNPLLAETDDAYITGRAWCEAVVQRLPEYMNSADAAYDAPTHPDNQHFGRRFKIVSFRWLSPSDI